MPVQQTPEGPWSCPPDLSGVASELYPIRPQPPTRNRGKAKNSVALTIAGDSHPANLTAQRGGQLQCAKRAFGTQGRAGTACRETLKPPTWRRRRGHRKEKDLPTRYGGTGREACGCVVVTEPCGAGR